MAIASNKSTPKDSSTTGSSGGFNIPSNPAPEPKPTPNPPSDYVPPSNEPTSPPHTPQPYKPPPKPTPKPKPPVPQNEPSQPAVNQPAVNQPTDYTDYNEPTPFGGTTIPKTDTLDKLRYDTTPTSRTEYGGRTATTPQVTTVETPPVASTGIETLDFIQQAQEAGKDITQMGRDNSGDLAELRLELGALHKLSQEEIDKIIELIQENDYFKDKSFTEIKDYFKDIFNVNDEYNKDVLEAIFGYVAYKTRRELLPYSSISNPALTEEKYNVIKEGWERAFIPSVGGMTGFANIGSLVYDLGARGIFGVEDIDIGKLPKPEPTPTVTISQPTELGREKTEAEKIAELKYYVDDAKYRMQMLQYELDEYQPYIDESYKYYEYSSSYLKPEGEGWEEYTSYVYGYDKPTKMWRKPKDEYLNILAKYEKAYKLYKQYEETYNEKLAQYKELTEQFIDGVDLPEITTEVTYDTVELLPQIGDEYNGGTVTNVTTDDVTGLITVDTDYKDGGGRYYYFIEQDGKYIKTDSTGVAQATSQSFITYLLTESQMAGVDSYEKMPDGSYKITYPHGTAYIYISEDGIRIVPVEDSLAYSFYLESGGFIPVGSIYYDAYMAQLKAIDDGFYLSDAWWIQETINKSKGLNYDQLLDTYSPSTAEYAEGGEGIEGYGTELFERSVKEPEKVTIEYDPTKLSGDLQQTYGLLYEKFQEYGDIQTALTGGMTEEQLKLLGISQTQIELSEYKDIESALESGVSEEKLIESGVSAADINRYKFLRAAKEELKPYEISVWQPEGGFQTSYDIVGLIEGVDAGTVNEEYLIYLFGEETIQKTREAIAQNKADQIIIDPYATAEWEYSSSYFMPEGEGWEEITVETAAGERKMWRRRNVTGYNVDKAIAEGVDRDVLIRLFGEDTVIQVEIRNALLTGQDRNALVDKYGEEKVSATESAFLETTGMTFPEYIDKQGQYQSDVDTILQYTTGAEGDYAYYEYSSTPQTGEGWEEFTSYVYGRDKPTKMWRKAKPELQEFLTSGQADEVTYDTIQIVQDVISGKLDSDTVDRLFGEDFLDTYQPAIEAIGTAASPIEAKQSGVADNYIDLLWGTGAAQTAQDWLDTYTLLPDNTWLDTEIINDFNDTESDNYNPEAYNILTTSGYSAYLQQLELAKAELRNQGYAEDKIVERIDLENGEITRDTETTYQLYQAIDVVPEETLVLLFGYDAVQKAKLEKAEYYDTRYKEVVETLNPMATWVAEDTSISETPFTGDTRQRSGFRIESLFQYMNQTQIETAMRSIGIELPTFVSANDVLDKWNSLDDETKRKVVDNIKTDEQVIQDWVGDVDESKLGISSKIDDVSQDVTKWIEVNLTGQGVELYSQKTVSPLAGMAGLGYAAVGGIASMLTGLILGLGGGVVKAVEAVGAGSPKQAAVNLAEIPIGMGSWAVETVGGLIDPTKQAITSASVIGMFSMPMILQGAKLTVKSGVAGAKTTVAAIKGDVLPARAVTNMKYGLESAVVPDGFYVLQDFSRLFSDQKFLAELKSKPLSDRLAIVKEQLNPESALLFDKIYDVAKNIENIKVPKELLRSAKEVISSAESLKGVDNIKAAEVIADFLKRHNDELELGGSNAEYLVKLTKDTPGDFDITLISDKYKTKEQKLKRINELAGELNRDLQRVDDAFVLEGSKIHNKKNNEKVVEVHYMGQHGIEFGDVFFEMKKPSVIVDGVRFRSYGEQILTRVSSIMKPATGLQAWRLFPAHTGRLKDIQRWADDISNVLEIMKRSKDSRYTETKTAIDSFKEAAPNDWTKEPTLKRGEENQKVILEGSYDARGTLIIGEAKVGYKVPEGILTSNDFINMVAKAQKRALETGKEATITSDLGSITAYPNPFAREMSGVVYHVTRQSEAQKFLDDIKTSRKTQVFEDRPMFFSRDAAFDYAIAKWGEMPKDLVIIALRTTAADIGAGKAISPSWRLEGFYEDGKLVSRVIDEFKVDAGTEFYAVEPNGIKVIMDGVTAETKVYNPRRAWSETPVVWLTTKAGKEAKLIAPDRNMLRSVVVNSVKDSITDLAHPHAPILAFGKESAAIKFNVGDIFYHGSLKWTKVGEEGIKQKLIDVSKEIANKAEELAKEEAGEIRLSREAEQLIADANIKDIEAINAIKRNWETLSKEIEGLNKQETVRYLDDWIKTNKNEYPLEIMERASDKVAETIIKKELDKALKDPNVSDTIKMAIENGTAKAIIEINIAKYLQEGLKAGSTAGIQNAIENYFESAVTKSLNPLNPDISTVTSKIGVTKDSMISKTISAIEVPSAKATEMATSTPSASIRRIVTTPKITPITSSDITQLITGETPPPTDTVPPPPTDTITPPPTDTITPPPTDTVPPPTDTVPPPPPDTPPPPPPPSNKRIKTITTDWDEEDVEKWKKEGFPAGTITWKQGMFWKVIPPPYDKSKPISMFDPPIGAINTDAVGEGASYKTLQVLGDKVPKDVRIDLGWTDVIIKTDPETNKPRIQYLQGGLETNVGSREQSNYSGMTIIGEPSSKDTPKKQYVSKDLRRSPYKKQALSLSEAIEEEPETKISYASKYNKPKQTIAKRGSIIDDSYLDNYYLGRKLPDSGLGVQI